MYISTPRGQNLERKWKGLGLGGRVGECDGAWTRPTALHEAHGSENILPYGTSPDEQHGVGFRIRGIPATFSAITDHGSLPFGLYDIQIESHPPGDYLFTDDVTLSEFLHLIERIKSGDWS